MADLPFVSVSSELRPLRFGFLVDSSKPAALLAAIQNATFLWAGAHSPIIPMVKRADPRVWGIKGVKGDEIVQGYIEAFDPDVIVTPKDVKLDASLIGNRISVSQEELLKDVVSRGSPSVGIGLIEVLDGWEKTEWKFSRQEKLKVIFPRIQGNIRDRLFLSSIFGSVEKR